MSTDTKAIPTVEEVRSQCLTARNLIASYPLCLDATIEDYPIGRGDRGKCRLQVERAKGKGYRTVRTTTNRNGVWCKPHKSTFQDGCIVVVTGLGGDRDIRWLSANERNVYLQAANGEGHVLAQGPCYSRPRREPHHYTMTATRYDLLSGTKLGSTDEEHVLPADPAELCDAWDAWYDEYRRIRAILEEVWNKSQ